MQNNFNILHLSDLHFGCENMTTAAKRKNVLNRLLDILKNVNNKWKPQLLVVSGDIGWKGSKEDYKLASLWLRELLATLELTEKEFICYPGNHDLDLEEAEFIIVPDNSEQADKYLQIENLSRFSQPFKNYISFCQEMGIKPLSIGNETSHLVGFREVQGMRLVVLNSSWFCRKNKKNELWIGLPHLQLMEASGQIGNDDVFTVSVLHHPPECLHDEETNSYGNRRNTYQYLARKNNMILSGHVHGVLKEHDQKFGQAYLFTGGSSYSSDRDRNNLSIFQVDKENGTILRRPFEFDPADGVWEYREKYYAAINFKNKKYESLEEKEKITKNMYKMLISMEKTGEEVENKQTSYEIKCKLFENNNEKENYNPEKVELNLFDLAGPLNHCRTRSKNRMEDISETLKKTIGKFLSDKIFTDKSNFSDCLDKFKTLRDFNKDKKVKYEFYIVFEADSDQLVGFPIEFLMHKNSLLFLDNFDFINYKRVIKSEKFKFFTNPLGYEDFFKKNTVIDLHFIYTNTFEDEERFRNDQRRLKLPFCDN